MKSSMSCGLTVCADVAKDTTINSAEIRIGLFETAGHRIAAIVNSNTFFTSYLFSAVVRDGKNFQAPGLGGLYLQPSQPGSHYLPVLVDAAETPASAPPRCLPRNSSRRA